MNKRERKSKARQSTMSNLGINLMKYVQGLYTKKTYKTQLRGSQYRKNGEIGHIHGWTTQKNVVKMSSLLPLIYEVNTIPTKVLAGFWGGEIDKPVKCIWIHKGL